MPMILHSTLSSCLSNDTEKTDHSKITLTDTKEENAEVVYIPNGSAGCRQYINKIRTIFLLIVVLILFCVNIILVVDYIHRPKITVNHQPVDRKKYGIFLPCLEDNTTERADGTHVAYCGLNSTAAIVDLVTLIFTEFVGRRNHSNDPPHRDVNRPVLKQKFSELYYADKINSTVGTLHIHQEKQLKKGVNDNQTSIAVLSDGMYTVFVSLQFCFREVEQSSQVVSVEIHRQSKQDDVIIYHSNIRPGNGLQTFVPDTCFLPVRLKQNDFLSLHVNGMSYLYEMRVGNVFGVKEVRKSEEYI